jgi:hypothetical protein
LGVTFIRGPPSETQVPKIRKNSTVEDAAYTSQILFFALMILGVLSTCIPRPRKKDIPENLAKAEKESRQGGNVPKGRYKPLRVP